MDLMFFDESQKVVEKSRSGTASSPEASSSEDQPQPTKRLVSQRRAKPKIQLNDVIFYQPLDGLALNFFMATYVGNDQINSQFDYLPELYGRHGSSHSALQETIKAVGLAGYAKASRRPEIIQPATKSYVAAIKEVNAALSDPNLVQQDMTLASVLLLAMFEVMVMPQNRGLENLTKHLKGATSLAAMQMKKQQQGVYSRKLMRSLCQSCIMNCWIQNIPLSDEFVAFKEQLGRDSDDVDYHYDFLDVLILLIKFRHAMESNIYDSPSAIIAQATALDGRLKRFMDNMPPDGRFKSVRRFTSARTSTDDQLTYQGYFHTYPKNFTAHFWNNIRSARIRLHSLVAAQCRTILTSPNRNQILDSGYASRLDASEHLVRELAREICATIPQLAGYLDQIQTPDPSPAIELPRSSYGLNAASSTLFISNAVVASGSSTSSYLKPPSPPQAVPSLPIPRPASQYHLLYQLRRLSATPALPEDMKGWIRQRIKWVEGNADEDDLKLLEAMLNTSPSGAFPFFVNI
jgi:hypothetical protein